MKIASVPRPSPLHVIVHVLIVRGREPFEIGEETSREGRPGVDALARATVGLIYKLYILARAETVDVRGW